MDKDNIFSEEYQEHYKSVTGGTEEALKKFVLPCEIQKLARNGKVDILDIGFGLGFNVVSAIDMALDTNPNCEISIYSLEKNMILDKLKTLNPGLKNYHIIKKLELDPVTNSYFYEDKNVFLKIKIGKAEELIKRIKNKFNACFLDPFSPKKNPELWNEEFIKDISKTLIPGAILATYSCARNVRDNLKKAGFFVEDGPKLGRRGPSTVATFLKP